MRVNTISRYTDPRLTNWRKILQRYQNGASADPRNTLRPTDGLRRIKERVVKAMTGTQGNLNRVTQRRLLVRMVRKASNL